MDIPFQKSQFLKIAFDSLESQLTQFLQTADPKPDWIIFDYASHWLPPLADKLGISSAFFSLLNAATMAFLGPPEVLLTSQDNRKTTDDFTVVPEWVPFESNVAFRVHEVVKFVEGSNESGTSDLVRFGAAIDGSDLILMRTCVEFEPEWFELLRELYRKPVVSVGVLPPDLEGSELENGENWICVREWLEKQGVSSVVFVALGTEATLTQTEISELALGLEQCGLPFFWVLRTPPGSSGDKSIVLPKGFEERVRGRGMVHFGWVPQVEILSHSAIGGFLTHCGWNSVIEGLAFGRVLILFPVMNDQGLNARLLQGKEVGVEIPRDNKDGSFTSDSVVETVRFAMVGEGGESIRANAREMRRLFGDKNRNDHYVGSSVHCLLERKT
ncbi:hypothetical protein RJ640_023531 [Escallonia rubra]|uniref:Uncharacterized protein n=1 Tax=Escallonia rubra TaxID=112253 RepID=A0AA88R2L9_9ASTE|nr:hypothetical protein RJ640_023531 [Escallonia rubra]